MSGLYRVVLRGACLGQAIVNNLAYRTGVGFDIEGLTVGGAETLANCVKNQVWPKMKSCLPTSYMLEAIDAYPYNDGTFELMTQNPYTLNVLETGTATGGFDGTAITTIIKFNLEPTSILFNGIKPPKRGYVAVGPVMSSWIDDAGKMESSVFINGSSEFNALATQLAANLESLLPPVIYYPIRIKSMNILGVWKPAAWADIKGAAVRRRTSFRRSRMAEG